MTAGGNIYDLGYRGYDGPRLGRRTVTLGLLRYAIPALIMLPCLPAWRWRCSSVS